MFHKITIVGNLGSDPEMRYTQTSQAVCNFSLASNRRYNDAAGNKVEEVIWFRVSVWGKLAETVNEYLSKGRMVLVEGRIKPDPQTGAPRLYSRQDGTIGTSFEITATEVRFLGGAASAGADGSYRDGEPTAIEDDQIPF